MSDGKCSHGKAMDEECDDCAWDIWDGEQEVKMLYDEDREKAEILINHAPLTGHERSILEIVLQDDEFKRIDRERFQQLINQHIHTIHTAQRKLSHFD